MKFLGVTFIFVLFVISIVALAVGIMTWMNATSDQNAVGTFFGLLFGMAITILGGVLLLIDIILIIIYKRRAKKV